MRALLALALLCGAAHADDAWVADDPSMPQNATSAHAYVTITTATARNFAWGVWSRLYHYSDVEASSSGPASESVAMYGQTYKYGKAPGWGILGECRAYNTGGCYGGEFDVVGLMPRSPGDHRTGVFVTGAGDVDIGVEIYGPFPRAVQIPAGSTISLDSGRGDAELKFDERTGYAGLWNARLGCWAIAWHAVRGDALRTCVDS